MQHVLMAFYVCEVAWMTWKESIPKHNHPVHLNAFINIRMQTILGFQPMIMCGQEQRSFSYVSLNMETVLLVLKHYGFQKQQI